MALVGGARVHAAMVRNAPSGVAAGRHLMAGGLLWALARMSLSLAGGATRVNVAARAATSQRAKPGARAAGARLTTVCPAPRAGRAAGTATSSGLTRARLFGPAATREQESDHGCKQPLA